MVRDHGAHIAGIAHSYLAAHQPKGQGEDRDGADIDGNVHGLVGIHRQHEAEHDDRHHSPHQQRHIGPRFAKKDMLEGVGVQVHKAKHHDGRSRDHCGETPVGHGGSPLSNFCAIAARTVAIKDKGGYDRQSQCGPSNAPAKCE